MDLSQAQVDAYQREGFLVIERMFSPAEMAVLEATLPEIIDPSRGKVGFDDVSGMVRLSHGAHLNNETIRPLSLHPRIISPLRRALFSVAFNSVDNRAQHPRNEHWATANVVPVWPLADDCLLTTAS